MQDFWVFFYSSQKRKKEKLELIYFLIRVLHVNKSSFLPDDSIIIEAGKPNEP